MIKIKVLGPGCSKCKSLYENAKTAVSELGLDAELSKVEDILEIMNYNVMLTPALVIDEKVVSSGKNLSVADIKEKIANA